MTRTNVARSSRKFVLKEEAMLKWALIFAILALVCGAFGFYGAASAFAGIAKILFFIAITIFVIFLVLGLIAARSVR